MLMVIYKKCEYMFSGRLHVENQETFIFLFYKNDKERNIMLASWSVCLYQSGLVDPHSARVWYGCTDTNPLNNMLTQCSFYYLKCLRQFNFKLKRFILTALCQKIHIGIHYYYYVYACKQLRHKLRFSYLTSKWNGFYKIRPAVFFLFDTWHEFNGCIIKHISCKYST